MRVFNSYYSKYTEEQISWTLLCYGVARAHENYICITKLVSLFNSNILVDVYGNFYGMTDAVRRGLLDSCATSVELVVLHNKWWTV